MNRSLPFVLLLLMMVTTLSLVAQNEKITSVTRCVFDENHERLLNEFPQMQSMEEFEAWMAVKLEEMEANPNERRATYTIPYVVHVVHGGQAVGVGSNITADLVNAQIQQINDDFRRENSDAANTPADFIGVAAAFDVEFVPAVVDPDGNIMAEPGIDRVDGLADFGVGGTWSTGQIDATLKPGTIWDRNLYMNVWSVDISGGILGYAQFPDNSTLPGMPTDGGPSTTDGVVCGYGTFGSLALPGSAGVYAYGRTLTHELGHWVGLLHTFQDGCGTGDNCDDTPSISGPNFTGEPCTYPGPNSCTDAGTDLPDMFQNYMDYSDDLCFNLYTQDQVDRMEVVFMNSPGRVDLLTSTVWMIPGTDTIIAGIDADDNAGCAPLTVTFADDSYSGPDADPITSYEWDFDVNGLGGASMETFSGANPGAVTFSNVGTYVISLDIDNGVYTGHAEYEVTVEGSIMLDVSMGFESGVPATWGNDNWMETGIGYASSASILHDNWSNSGRIPAYLTTPSVNFDVMATYVTLTFDVSHANYTTTGLGADEGMAVEYSTDCGETWTEIWRKLDSDPDPFYTVGPDVGNPQWFPAGDQDWREEEVDLTSLMGESAVRLRFVGISDYGHDTYLDNILIAAITVSDDDVIADMAADPTSGCQGLEVTFTDLSTTGAGTSITSWEWDFDVTGIGGASPSTHSGETPPVVTYSTGGTYTAQLIVSDGVNSDTAEVEIEVEPSIAVPFVVDFESGIPANFTATTNWFNAAVGYASSGSMFQDNWSSTNDATTTSPSFDLSGPADEATLSFDVAHTFFSGFGPEDEGMAVSYSIDCGATWTEIYHKLDSDPDPFYTVEGGAGSAWTPAGDGDWRTEEIDIIGLVGNGGVKFRFDGIGAFGNNTYVDNINVFTRVVDPNTIEAEFSADPLKICAGQTIDFTDLSLIGTGISGTTWDWDFDMTGVGTADPATFSGQTPPSVIFETGGMYTVELTVSGTGSAGAVSSSFSLDVEVEGAGPLPIAEDFEAGVFPAGWTAEASEVGAISIAGIGFQSDNGVFIDNYSFPDLLAELTLPSLDFTAVGRAELTFDLSHTYYQDGFGSLYDSLALVYSLDCGATWTEFWGKYDGDVLDPLYTADPTGAGFVPVSDDEWRAESVDVTFLQGYDNVKIRFVNRGGYGNSLFLDNINIDAELVAPDEVFAYFTVDGGLGCLGSEIVFTDASTAGANTAITSWEWDFDATGIGGADPSTFSGQTPPAVVFSEVGDYEVVLTVSDGDVSDDYTTTVSFGASEDLTFTENFSMTTFPPEGWTNIMWEQAAESSDPILGSLFADNYFNVDFKANIWTPALDMSWYDQVEMTFDVAHARYSGNENEGIVISGSSDCGATFDAVWDKYDFDADPLYTHDPFETGAWFPETADDWREESVDLSVFNDYNAVRVEIFNDGFYGNNTFVDDLKIEGWLFNPTDLTATTDGNDIELSWTDNSGKESNYDVLRMSPGMADFELVATLDADATSYTDNNLDGPEYYTYQVCAWNEKARACSNEASDSIASVLQVDGLVAILIDPEVTSIELFWNDESTTEDGFYVKRSTDGVNFTIINTLTPNQEYYLDEFLDETTTYFYQICAFNADEIAESNIADETTDIYSPSNLIATADGINVHLTWTDNSLVEENYQIKRSETSGGPYAIVTVVPSNITAYTDFNRDENTEYCYIVCAYNSVATGCGPEDCATTGVASAVFDDLDAAISIYPNPASNYFELEMSGVNGDLSIKIFNQIGDLMLSDILYGGATRRIELDNFASGMYMIRLQTDDGFTTKKLIVE